MSKVFSPFQFDNSFVRHMEGFFEPWQGARVPAPAMVCFNQQLADELGMDADAMEDSRLAAFFCGMLTAEGSEPVAMAYAGHQFGGFSPRLGDGRALLLGEITDIHGRRRDLHLKGSGRTQFSRGGDGKAVLGPVLREYLMGEAMYALGVPTSRALAAVTTGEDIYRDGIKPGAVLARVASSHIRVGTFEYAASRGDHEGLRELVYYSLKRHYPELMSDEAPALALLNAVSRAQAKLVARWMGIGFIHGVMNTDNVTISGETIDYGPCAFMDSYDARTVFSSIDHDGRYAYGNQPGIARWNLARFAEALLPLLAEDESEALAHAQSVLDGFAEVYTNEWLAVFAAKFGLKTAQDGDLELFMDFLTLLGELKLDFTRAFRALANSLGDTSAAGIEALSDDSAKLAPWLTRWHERLGCEYGPQSDFAPDARALMQGVNPVYVPRNHLLQGALDRAEAGDMGPFERLLEVVCRPYEERAGYEAYALGAPEDFGPFRTFCGT
ncbi:protein adenylyltransferase SelO [Shewanella zhangzhouensis]|uniref:protein adenylyltransferase SelO n=1 Tax=Shewanella zhangzhouensis TaxID=2864213 RepID=UPI001C657948|nr:YdiU family protein [Shewanella zhangzhouensis]QYK04403.1 YdiU family protein [Shewanella zhangzhouensis]